MSPEAVELLGLGPHGHAPPHAALPWFALALGASMALRPVRAAIAGAFRKLRDDPPSALCALALVAGVILRLIFPGDIEYKADEAWMFKAADGIWRGDPWPAVGMPSSSGLPNPGFSVWIFRALAWLSGADSPVQLAHTVAWLNVAALFSLFVFAWRQPAERRDIWWWVVALAAVDPLGILLQRKIWAQSVLPVFSLALFLGWRCRSRVAGAFVWGLTGAVIGQIHMSGFVYAAAFLLWSLTMARKTTEPVRWLPWAIGTGLGIFPCIPWLLAVTRQPVMHPAPLQGGSPWVMWLQDSVGWNLDYSFAASDVPADFSRLIMPGGVVAIISLAVAIVIAGLFIRQLATDRPETLQRIRTAGEGHGAAFIGYCLLMQLLPVPFFRHYLLVAWPFPSMTLPLLAGRQRWTLGVIWSAHALAAVSLLWFLHLYGGSPNGDFGLTWQYLFDHADVLSRPAR